MLYAVVALVVSTASSVINPEPVEVKPQFEADSPDEVFSPGVEVLPADGLFVDWLESTGYRLADGAEPVITALNPETGQPVAITEDEQAREAFGKLMAERDEALARIDSLLKDGAGARIADLEKQLAERTLDLNEALEAKVKLIEQRDELLDELRRHIAAVNAEPAPPDAALPVREGSSLPLVIGESKNEQGAVYMGHDAQGNEVWDPPASDGPPPSQG